MEEAVVGRGEEAGGRKDEAEGREVEGMA